ncbi:MAG: zinc ribbon domain-containing protein, partial [Bacillota bacterium]|nr:zinc ribbon domain-containing protein [Bacillota bacterium]
MYCQKCGSPLQETETVCSVCGTEREAADAAAPIDENNREAGVSDAEEAVQEADGGAAADNRNTTEFKWNVYNFPKPKRTEDIDFHWGLENDGAAGEPPLQENAGEAEEDPIERFLREEIERAEAEQARAAEEGAPESSLSPELDFPDSDLELLLPELQETADEENPPETLILPEAGELAETGAPASVEEIGALSGKGPEETPSLGRWASEERKTERFYTFSKKNEEFQKLLDKEYERIRGRESAPVIGDNETLRRHLWQDAVPGAAVGAAAIAAMGAAGAGAPVAAYEEAPEAPEAIAPTAVDTNEPEEEKPAAAHEEAPEAPETIAPAAVHTNGPEEEKPAAAHEEAPPAAEAAMAASEAVPKVPE